jgi:hypothetical protein
MSTLKQLENHCIGTAESEDAYIESIFLDSKSYNDAIATIPGSPRLIIGKKGTGKSAILKRILKSCIQEKIVCKLYKPEDLSKIIEVGQLSDIASSIKLIYESIVCDIAIEFGRQFRGLLSKDEKKLFDKAQQKQGRSGDIISVAAKLLPNIGKAITDINFNSFIPEESLFTNNSEEIVETLKRVNQGSNRIFYVLIDDIDRIQNNGNKLDKNKIWAFLLAIRKISENFNNCKCVVSIRNEIWTEISGRDTELNDQVDHFGRLVTKISNSEDDIKKIIEKRLRYVAFVEEIGTNNVESKFFENNTTHLPNTSDRRPWLQFISKSGRLRARDSIILLAELAKRSRESQFQKIAESIVEDASLHHSEEIINLACAELEDECPKLRSLIETFKCSDQWIFEFDVFMKHLNNTLGGFGSGGLVINKKQIHQNNDDDLITYLKFIHEIGFANPLVPDDRESKKYRHILFSENESFVRLANSDLPRCAWEIHPVYRSYIQKIRSDENARSKISLKALLGFK